MYITINKERYQTGDPDGPDTEVYAITGDYTEQDIASLVEDPWQIFKAAEPIIVTKER